MKKQYIKLLCFVLLLGGGLLFNSHNAQAAGEMASDIPTGANVWLVVTGPGGNGMDAPNMNIRAYVPLNVDTFNLKIQDACDTTVNDDSGGNNSTRFIFAPVRDVTTTDNATNTLVDNASDAPSGDTHTARCVGAVDSNLTISLLADSAYSQVKVNTASGSITYKVVPIRAELRSSSTAYYVNRFRYSTTTTGVKFGYASVSTDPGSDTARYTGIAYNDRAAGWGWSTTIAFAQPCGTADTTSKVYFWDTDDSNKNTSSSPYWQNNNQPQHWKIEEYNRNTDAYIGVLDEGDLKGGNNVADSTPVLSFRSDRRYRLIISNVNYINSIQVALPYQQVYASDICHDPLNDPVSCTLQTFVGASARNPRPGEAFTARFTLTAGPRGFKPNSGTIQFGANGAVHYAGSPYGVAPVTYEITGTRGSANYNFDASLTNASGNQMFESASYLRAPGVSISLDSNESTTIDVDNVQLYRRSSSYAGSNSTLVAPYSPGTYPFDWGFVIPGVGWANSYCNSSVTVDPNPPNITASCSVTASSFEVGGTYYPQITFTNPTRFSTTPNASVTFSIDGVAGTTRTASAIALPPATASGSTNRTAYVTASGYTVQAGDKAFSADTGIAMNTPGTYTGRYDWSWSDGTNSGPPGGTDCTVSITIISRPYFKVHGDIVSRSTTQDLKAWNQGLGRGALGYEASFPIILTGQSGAGASGLVLAPGVTSGIASKFKNPGSTPRSLTLANDALANTTNFDGTWGGAFGTVSQSMPSPTFVNKTGLRTATDVNGNGGDTEVNLSGSSLGGGIVGGGKQLTVYASGDVYITSNITYAGSNAFGNFKNIPRFRLVTSGNIFINPAVTQLDGEYIAGNGGTGSVYTCFVPGWTVPLDGTAENPYNVPGCRNTLLVNGALIGDSIKLTRVGGTLRNATITDGFPSGLNSYVNSGNIAEIIQFTPEIYLAQPAGDTNNANEGRYDSITALPPLF